MIDCIPTNESRALTPLAPEYRGRRERFTWGCSSPKNRHGVTLIELLTVLGIVTLVALLVLPSVKTMLTDRKSTNAATMVRNFLEAARARAVGSQIPVAVVLERVSSVPLDTNDDGLIDGFDLINGRLQSATSTDPLPAVPTPLPLDTNFLPYNSCIRLSMAEQPLPITEKMLAPGISVVHLLPIDWAGIFQPPAPIRNPALSAQEIASRRYFAVDTINRVNGNKIVGNQLIRSLFSVGSEVSFKNSNTRHLIIETEFDSNEILWFTVLSSQAIQTNLEQAIPSNDFIATATYGSFTVFQKPKPINGSNIQLPKGMCIDLSLSGFSSVGNLSFTDGSGFHDHDQRIRFSSAWVTGGLFVPSAQTLRPIYIVFSPDGSLSRVYANGMGSPNSIPIELADDLFLHIGKIDQVVLTPKRPNTVSSSPAVPENITDPSMYVVRLSSKSGGLSVAPATQGIPRTLEIGDVLELTRQGTYGASLTGQ